MKLGDGVVNGSRFSGGHRYGCVGGVDHASGGDSLHAHVLSALRTLLLRPAIRVAVRNFTWLTVEKVVRLVLGVGVGFWVARYLGPARLGILGYCTALVTLLGFLPTLGLESVVKRDLLERPAATAELLASTLALRLAAGVLAYALVMMAVCVGWGLHDEEPRLLVILGLLLFQPALFVPDLWLQAHLRASWSVVPQLLALLVGAMLRVVLIVTGASLAAFAAVVVVEMVLSAAGIRAAGRRLGLRTPLSLVRLSTMSSLMHEAWPLALSGLAVVVYMKIDEVMLRQMIGPAAVGFYTAAAKLSEVWYFLPMVLASSVLPALLRARAQGMASYSARMQQYYDLSVGAAYLLSVPIALAAPWVVRLAYGDAFATAGPILAVHIWSSVFVFLGVARGQWLVNERLSGFYLATTLAGALVNVLLNFVAIPRWGGLGAAWATLISYAMAAWLVSFFHPAVRATAIMQTRALLIPVFVWRYLWRR